jgi:hypothetical protein
MIATDMIQRLRELDALEGNGRIAVLDTEADSACTYADEFDFDLYRIDEYSPEIYIQCVRRVAA